MVIMNDRVEQALSDIISDLNTEITHVGYGSGVTTPNVTDTTLTTETFRNAKSSTTVLTSSIRVIGRLASTENNTTNAEIGTFDASSSGNLSMHNLLNSFVKTSSMRASFIIIGEIEVTQ